MSGFNMPPGVSPNDIPGNRLEDEEWEEAADRFLDALHDLMHEWAPALTEDGAFEVVRQYVDEEIERRVAPEFVGLWAKQKMVFPHEIHRLAVARVKKKVADAGLPEVPLIRVALTTRGLIYWVKVASATRG